MQGTIRGPLQREPARAQRHRRELDGLEKLKDDRRLDAGQVLARWISNDDSIVNSLKENVDRHTTFDNFQLGVLQANPVVDKIELTWTSC